MIFTCKNAIPKELITALKDRSRAWLSENREGKFGSIYNRVGETISFGAHQEFLDLDAKLSEFIQEFTAEVVVHRYKPAFPIGDSGFEYHRYNPGDMCFLHTDGETSFKRGEDRSLLRFATIILHLNTVEGGGETVFPMQNQSFKTIEGQVLVFPPYGTHPHYVTPTPETREILMTWLVYSGINVVRS